MVNRETFEKHFDKFKDKLIWVNMDDQDPILVLVRSYEDPFLNCTLVESKSNNWGYDFDLINNINECGNIERYFSDENNKDLKINLDFLNYFMFINIPALYKTSNQFAIPNHYHAYSERPDIESLETKIERVKKSISWIEKRFIRNLFAKRLIKLKFELLILEKSLDVDLTEDARIIDFNKEIDKLNKEEKEKFWLDLKRYLFDPLDF